MDESSCKKPRYKQTHFHKPTADLGKYWQRQDTDGFFKTSMPPLFLSVVCVATLVLIHALESSDDPHWEGLFTPIKTRGF